MLKYEVDLNPIKASHEQCTSLFSPLSAKFRKTELMKSESLMLRSVLNVAVHRPESAGWDVAAIRTLCKQIVLSGYSNQRQEAITVEKAKWGKSSLH